MSRGLTSVEVLPVDDRPSELYVRKIMVNTFLRWRQRRRTGCRLTPRGLFRLTLPARAA